MQARAQNGFTLWELLMALLVVGIVLGFGVPSFVEFQRNGAMTAAANNLVTGVLAARSEAVKRRVPVALCLFDEAVDPPVCLSDAVADALGVGFIVWVDENGDGDLTDATDGDGVFDAGEQLVMRSAAPGGQIRVSADCGRAPYGPNGYLQQMGCAHATRTFLYCDDRGNRESIGQLSSARLVRIDRLGRGQVFQDVAEVANAIDEPDELSAVSPTCP